MRALAWAVVTFRHAVVAGWIAAAVAATLWLPQLQQSQGGALSDVVAKGSEAVKVEARSRAALRRTDHPGHDGGPARPERPVRGRAEARGRHERSRSTPTATPTC